MILLFSPSVSGGLAEHTFYQAKALEKAGATVTCLIAPSFLLGRSAGFETITCLSDPPASGRSRLAKKIKMVWRLLANRVALAWHICKRQPDLVLLDSYVEYMAPLWVWPHWILARLCSVKYAANLHDPVRNYVVGPKWWHKLSVRMAYWPLDFVLVHDKLPEPSPVPGCVRVVQVPCGLYDIMGVSHDPASVRGEWGVQEGQKVFLAFGYIRDGKNLDLAVRALADVPKAFLVVAGSVASRNDKPFAYYRELAQEMGVAERCRFFDGFVADSDLGRYFAGADYVLLTYAASFCSQSGVLNVAARARKPVLVAGSASPLVNAVRSFNLGVIVAPDSADATRDGMRQLMASPPSPRWDEYEQVASWGANARGILRAMGCPENLAVAQAEK